MKKTIMRLQMDFRLRGVIENARGIIEGAA